MRDAIAFHHAVCARAWPLAGWRSVGACGRARRRRCRQPAEAIDHPRSVAGRDRAGAARRCLLRPIAGRCGGAARRSRLPPRHGSGPYHVAPGLARAHAPYRSAATRPDKPERCSDAWRRGLPGPCGWHPDTGTQAGIAADATAVARRLKAGFGALGDQGAFKLSDRP